MSIYSFIGNTITLQILVCKHPEGSGVAIATPATINVSQQQPQSIFKSRCCKNAAFKS